MRVLVNLILIGIAIFALISFFSGAKFGDVMKGSYKIAEENGNEASVGEWKVETAIADAKLDELAVMIEQYNAGEIESPSGIEDKITEIIAQMEKLDKYKNELSGDEKKEYRKKMSEIDDKWEEIQDNYKIVQDILSESDSDPETTDHFFGD